MATQYGHGMTEVTPKLHMIGLIVESMEASLEFYRHLGLASPERLSNHHVQFPASDVTLFLDDDPVEWDPQFAEMPFGSLVEFFLGSEATVRAKAEQMAARGFEPVRPPYITKYGMCFAMFEDPDGNRILLSGNAAGD
jgi:catechol 2,3-dioxygenase-like lactoylglutathione lyase family enzyme